MGGQVQKVNSSPDYKRIYMDIIKKKHPQKLELCQSILKKKELKILDVIKLDELIFNRPNKEEHVFNQKHRFYDKSTVLEILDFQKKNNYNNSQLAKHFNISRNSITKWKRLFII